MGVERDFLRIWIMFSATFLFQHVKASQNPSQNSLNSFLHDYALDTIPEPRTRNLYELPPPINFSGIGVSLLRLRTHSLWENGANLSSVTIPSMALPLPFTRRVDLVFQDLGNWSTSYYNVPSYTSVSPVIGLLAYDSDPGSTSLATRLVELDIRGDIPIMVRFHNVSLQQYDHNVKIQCVRFAIDGSLEFSNVTEGSSCVARNQGHFSIVVPTVGERKTAEFKWWMVGIPAAVVGVILIAVLGFLCRWLSMTKMEKMSGKSEGLNSIWIGNSRMPYASAIRTQPNLENSYVP